MGLLLEQDKLRYKDANPPAFQRYYRIVQDSSNPLKKVYIGFSLVFQKECEELKCRIKHKLVQDYI